MFKVSICIVAFNAEKTLPDTLRSAISVLKSTSSEIVFIDDGSTDGTLIVASELLSEIDENRKQIHSQANLGTAASRNLAISKSRSTWIYFLDADDQLLPANFVRVTSLLDCVQSDVIRTNWKELIIQKPELNSKFLAESGIEVTNRELETIADKQQFVRERGYWRYFYRSQLLAHQKDLFSPKFSEVNGRYTSDDYYFLVRIANRIVSFAAVEITTYLYRKPEAGLSKKILYELDLEGSAMAVFLKTIREEEVVTSFIAEEMYYRFKIVSQIQKDNKRRNAKHFHLVWLLRIVSKCNHGKIKKCGVILLHYLQCELPNYFLNRSR